MAIVVEDGTGVTGANSYVTEAELTTYATNRGVTITGTNSVLIYKSMDYLEQKDFKGDKLNSDQALQWPRYNVFVDGYYVDSDTIPTLLKEAQMELCLSIDNDVDPMATLGREIKREKIDVIEVEYTNGASNRSYITAAELKLVKLLKNGGTVSTIRV